MSFTRILADRNAPTGSKPADLRKMKDRATLAMTRERFREAEELYAQIAKFEPDGDWLQRAGDAARRAGLIDNAIDHLSTASTLYASRRFNQKAIAIAKVVLQLDPHHAGALTLVRYLDVSRPSFSGAAPLLVPSR